MRRRGCIPAEKERSRPLFQSPWPPCSIASGPKWERRRRRCPLFHSPVVAPPMSSALCSTARGPSPVPPQSLAAARNASAGKCPGDRDSRSLSRTIPVTDSVASAQNRQGRGEGSGRPEARTARVAQASRAPDGSAQRGNDSDEIPERRRNLSLDSDPGRPCLDRRRLSERALADGQPRSLDLPAWVGSLVKSVYGPDNGLAKLSSTASDRVHRGPG